VLVAVWQWIGRIVINGAYFQLPNRSVLRCVFTLQPKWVRRPLHLTSYLEIIIQLKRNVMFEIFTNAHPRIDANKTSLGWHSYASCQSDAHQLGRQSFQCSWTSSLELSADGPQTAGLVTQPFQAVAENVFIWSVRPKHSMISPLNCTRKILLLTMLGQYMLRGTDWALGLMKASAQCGFSRYQSPLLPVASNNNIHSTYKRLGYK